MYSENIKHHTRDREQIVLKSRKRRLFQNSETGNIGMEGTVENVSDEYEDPISANYVIGENQMFLFVSKGFQNLTGYTREELLQKKYYELVHPDDHDKVKRVILRKFGGEDSGPYGFRLISRQNGMNGTIIFNVLCSSNSVLFNSRRAIRGHLRVI